MTTQHRIAAVLLVALALCASGCAGLSQREKEEINRIAAELSESAVVEEPPLPSAVYELAGTILKDPMLGGPQHHAALLDSGIAALIARIHLIRSARETIDIQTFIWVDDVVGRLLFHELLMAARRGVRVRVLMDQFCKITDPRIMARAATVHTNLEVKLYNPVGQRLGNRTVDVVSEASLNFKLLNQRMHNKIVVVDKRLGIVGGRNVEDRYYDWDPKFVFRDRDILVAGPACREMSRSFRAYWAHPLAVPAIHLVDVAETLRAEAAAGDRRPIPPLDTFEFEALIDRATRYDLHESEIEIMPVWSLEFVADRPEKAKRGTYDGGRVTRRIRELVSDARHRVVTQTPYMLMTLSQVHMFGRLRERNPNISLVFSTNSLAATDKFYVYALSYKYRKFYVKDLMMDIYELRPFPASARDIVPNYDELIARHVAGDFDADVDYGGLVPTVDVQAPRLCIHAKSFVVDGHVSFVGSHNFDPRSNRLNTECGVIVHDEWFAMRLEDSIARDRAPGNSWVVGRKQRVPVISEFSDFFASISRMLPVFDVWPFRYSTCYRLKEGMPATSPHDAAFFDAYEVVGEWPEVNLSSETLFTQFMAAFGGWSAPLM